MRNPPRTKEAAKKYVYGLTSFNPDGWPYNKRQCAWEITPIPKNIILYSPYQCYKAPGFGPDKLYCEQHAKRLDSRRDGKRKRRTECPGRLLCLET